MSARAVKCPHVANIPACAQAEVKRAKEVSTCKECGSHGPNLWICLHKDCYKVGCGEAHGDHSTLHNRVSPCHRKCYIYSLHHLAYILKIHITNSLSLGKDNDRFFQPRLFNPVVLSSYSAATVYI